METIEKLTENPFMAAALITISITLLFYLFVSPFLAEFPPRRLIFKAMIYMFLTTLFITHMHAKSVKSFYEKKINERLGVTSINRTGSSELEISPSINTSVNTITPTVPDANAFL